MFFEVPKNGFRAGPEGRFWLIAEVAIRECLPLFQLSHLVDWTSLRVHLLISNEISSGINNVYGAADRYRTIHGPWLYKNTKESEDLWG